MAIGAGWVDGAWVDAGWVAEAWSDVAQDAIGDAWVAGAWVNAGWITAAEPGGAWAVGVQAALGSIVPLFARRRRRR